MKARKKKYIKEIKNTNQQLKKETKEDLEEEIRKWDTENKRKENGREIKFEDV